ncbi:hypothetical protein PanWU01x14_204290 [Parasponia andersonii]|uniref:Uncharacterized protein n=1 Tax=Parasponia andersonii TaxID=3476 RepID=A0A2P5BWN5_PARAD|nr:hypothetical protein PanWU01x14_204290 [Parasponia andersonii]
MFLGSLDSSCPKKALEAEVVVSRCRALQSMFEVSDFAFRVVAESPRAGVGSLLPFRPFVAESRRSAVRAPHPSQLATASRWR